MKKINIDGLLALKLEEIKIIFLRCRGETVEDTAKELKIGASTIYSRMPKIYELLGVSNWGEIEEELCIALRRIVPNTRALDEGWPEAFREKIEALREPVEPQTRTTPPSAIPPSPEPTFAQARNTSGQASPPQRRIPWPLIAIPLLVFGLLCIAGIVFGLPLLGNIFEQEPTQSEPTQTTEPTVPDTSTSEASATIEPTITEVILPTDTIAPTFTFVATDTLTPMASETPIPTQTKPPIGLTVGDELRDDRVTLQLLEVRYFEGYDRVGQRVAPISYIFEYTNHSGGTLVVQFDTDNFVIEDNTGSTAECWFFLSPFTAFEEWNSTLNDNASVIITARCGLGRAPDDVTSYELTIHPFTSLPESTWVVEVPR
jgi:DNA-binding CsgD family transcriptional regulator